VLLAPEPITEANDQPLTLPVREKVFHSILSKQYRDNTFTWVTSGLPRMIVSTDCGAVGINLPGIKRVVLLSMAKSANHLLQ
jgi:superfamily II DNA or RNA helicase